MLNRPTLLTTPSFDATKEKIFEFVAQAGGSQIVANQLTIRDQEDNSIVYQNIQNSFKYQHVLPANTLQNGKYYNATISVLDAQGEQSANSYPIQFRCYTAPVLMFTNIPSTGVINNGSYAFEFRYEQDEGEELNSYVVNLYNSSEILISTSKIVCVENGRPPYIGTYLFNGLDDNATYYVQVSGDTVNGAQVGTSLIKIEVDYKKPDLFTLLALKNNCEEGTISVSSNIILIDADYQPDPPIFIDDKEIDLMGDDAFIEWNKGYKINGDFLARAWFRKPKVNSTIVQFSNTQGETIKINYMRGYESVESPDIQSYVTVEVSSINGAEYYVYSNYINNLTDIEYYVLQLKKKDGLYQVALMEKGGA